MFFCVRSRMDEIGRAHASTPVTLARALMCLKKFSFFAFELLTCRKLTPPRAVILLSLSNVFLRSLPYGWMQSPPISRGNSLSFEECLFKMTRPLGILAVV